MKLKILKIIMNKKTQDGARNKFVSVPKFKTSIYCMVITGIFFLYPGELAYKHLFKKIELYAMWKHLNSWF